MNVGFSSQLSRLLLALFVAASFSAPTLALLAESYSAASFPSFTVRGQSPEHATPSPRQPAIAFVRLPPVTGNSTAQAAIQRLPPSHSSTPENSPALRAPANLPVPQPAADNQHASPAVPPPFTDQYSAALLGSRATKSAPVAPSAASPQRNSEQRPIGAMLAERRQALNRELGLASEATVPSLTPALTSGNRELVAEPDPPAELDIVGSLPRVAAIAENQLVARHVQAGIKLAERGAYYSARREFEHALRVIAESLDAHEPQGKHGEHLTAAFDALEEADEFFVDDPRSSGRVNLRHVAVTHRTPLMRNGELDGLNQVAAMQAYYAFAQQKFHEAVGSQRSAADALYGLGRVYTALASTDEAIGRLYVPKSLLMHQVASQIDPNHSLAANELGVLLARFGQLTEAKQALLRIEPESRLPETWHNLAIVHQRLGESELAAAAEREYLAAKTAQTERQVVTVHQDGVEWVDVSAAENMARQRAPADTTTPRAATRPTSPRWPWSTPR